MDQKSQASIEQPKNRIKLLPIR